MDLGGRFARFGRVFRVGPETRLRGLFGSLEVDDDVLASPLVDYLVRHHGEDRFAGAGRLTLAQLWEPWLEKAWRVEAAGGLALDVLLGFAALDGRGPDFVRVMKERNAEAVREALHAYLAGAVGAAGPLVWKAWESGRGAELLGLGVLAQAVSGVEDAAVQMWWKLTAAQVSGGGADPALFRQIGEASEAALRLVEQRAGAAEARAIVLAADARITVEEIRPLLAGSRRLPSAWHARLASLGQALVAGARSPSREAVRAATDQLRALASHVLYADPEQTYRVERAEMAVRLLGWLAVRPDRDIVRSATPYTEVECLGRWYAAEGGFVDWARRWARGEAGSPLAAGIMAVVAAADRERVALDLAFARALPGWLEARRPASQCVPIDQAVARIAGPFLDGGPERRLLVLLMDGMAWAQLVEILGGLGTEAAAWGPLAWHAMGKNRIGEGPVPAMLANFPTVTDVSRSAFFAGKPVPAGVVHSSQADGERWKSNKTALAFTPAHDVPRLLLKGDSQWRDGSASPEALSLVADPARRLVAVVVNAIDSFLKADVAQRVRWTADSIKSLRDLLEAARQAKRSVLLCADHGHVPADRLEPAGAARTGGARWRPWESPAASLAAWEVGFSVEKDGVWAPRGAHGVVLLADDAHKYGGGSTAGEHGGATLAEVVTPCLLVGCEDNPAAEDDPALRVMPAPVPGWWHFDVGGEPPAPGDVSGGPAPVPERPRKKRISANQLPLLPDAPPLDGPEPRGSPFARSKVLEARAPAAELRIRVIRAVEFLLERGGTAGAAAFAGAIGEFPVRVPSVVSKLQEVLNVDGYEVLRLDRKAGQVHLDKGKLCLLFEVTL